MTAPHQSNRMHLIEPAIRHDTSILDTLACFFSWARRRGPFGTHPCFWRGAALPVLPIRYSHCPYGASYAGHIITTLHLRAICCSLLFSSNSQGPRRFGRVLMDTLDHSDLLPYTVFWACRPLSLGIKLTPELYISLQMLVPLDGMRAKLRRKNPAYNTFSTVYTRVEVLLRELSLVSEPWWGARLAVHPHN